ncbi:MAG: VPLPA-CTERM sorting domain-containing protein [Erythrobacter sp.]|nr:VPLPA-CTERM sorting domain-containing protein [Erythrobacter sp.]
MGLFKYPARIPKGIGAVVGLGLILGGSIGTAANAALVAFQSFNGKVALSTDGWGGLDGSGVISASAPSGSTVIAAYLYTATQNSSTVPTTVTLDGNSVTYTASFANATACCNLRSNRVDVTSLVKPVIDGGGGGVYNFAIEEGGANGAIDGHALVVVYSNAALPEASVGILDGFASVTGDTTSINFANALDPSDPGFFAEMILGINFSCCSQKSRVDVNGQLLTENAGNKDDGENGDANGNLITVGSFDDPFAPLNPTYATDSERYNLASFITAGDTSIKVDTFNASQDDNIFLAAFYVSGEAGFNQPPPSTSTVPLPAAGWLLVGGLGGLAGLRRRRKAA